MTGTDMQYGMMTYIKPSDLDFVIACELFGWKWMAYHGIPIKGTAGYPAKCRVRQCFPKESQENTDWQQYLATWEGAPATGEEPLAYAYCSSQGPAMPLPYSSSLDSARLIEQELEKRGQLVHYLLNLCLDVNRGGMAMHVLKATPEQRCLAALKTIGSSYVHPEPAQEPPPAEPTCAS